MAVEIYKNYSEKPALTICLLNYFHVEVDGQPLPSCGPKADALMSMLGLRREYRANRAEVMQALWPDADEMLAAQNLNSLNSNLKKALGRFIGNAAPVIAEDGTYRLNSDAGIAVDVTLFDGLSDRAQLAMRAGDQHAVRQACDRALDLYRGNLHSRETNDYLMQFERLRARYLGLLAWLANMHASRAEWDDAMRCAYRILAEDECREDAHRIVMQALAAHGQRTQALRQFKLCAGLMRHEFDAPPEPATQLLYDSLRSGSDALLVDLQR